MSAIHRPLPAPSDLADAWGLDPTVVFLNHGSFGACPRVVLAAQDELRRRLEAEPVRFMIRELPELLDRARGSLAGFVGADPAGLAFVANATTGVNTALASIPLDPGDEVLVTDHGYAACANAALVRARAAGARLVEVALPFPGASDGAVVERVLGAVGPRTRVAIVDHVTSPTGLVLPVAELVRRLEERDVTVIVDGAHAPGMVELEVGGLAAPFYTGNCHKWLCAPKGAAFLWARQDWRERTRPLVTSHGFAAPLAGRSRLHLEFDWTGTADPTPWLTVPAAIDAVAALVDGGWPEVRRRNRTLALAARSVICAALETDEPCPESMIGALAAVPLPGASTPRTAGGLDPLQDRLYHEHRIEVPVTEWASGSRRALRISAHLYNAPEQIRYLADALGG
ncbi:MAG: aminotransferase class V-fold PLP-dependent enzyme [Thermoanaerobaculales bacterium]|nr:aminotransferase class V-fold PLP-dependent enzyme [Thermoanaerobaculales bacterium]